jgi:hypothetical protein
MGQFFLQLTSEQNQSLSSCTRSHTAMSRHQRIWIEAILWAIAEIILSSSALDTLADYNEFLLNQKTGMVTQSAPFIRPAQPLSSALGLAYPLANG